MYACYVLVTHLVALTCDTFKCMIGNMLNVLVNKCNQIHHIRGIRLKMREGKSERRREKKMQNQII